jgi:hypothetical protein
VITEFMPVRLQIFYNDRDGFTAGRSPLGPTFTDREQAIAWAAETLNTDDFQIATLHNGRLAAIGFEMRDFDDEDLTAIAADIGLEPAGGVLR